MISTTCSGSCSMNDASRREPAPADGDATRSSVTAREGEGEGSEEGAAHVRGSLERQLAPSQASGQALRLEGDVHRMSNEASRRLRRHHVLRRGRLHRAKRLRHIGGLRQLSEEYETSFEHVDDNSFRTTLDRGCATQPRHTQHTQHSRATLSGCAPAQPWTHGAAHGSRCQADRAVVRTVCKPNEPKRPHAVRDDLCSTERTVTAVLERAGLPAPLPLVLNHSRLDAARRCGEAVA
jgi:hypothetical protein